MTAPGKAGRRWAACAWRRFRWWRRGRRGRRGAGLRRPAALDRAVGHRRQLGTWQALPALDGVTGSPAAARRADGRYVIVAATSAGALYYTRQLPAAKAPEWQDWRRVPAPQAAGGLAAIRDHERRVELYFRQRGENHLIRLVEAGDTSDTNMDWSEPADLGVPYIGRPAVGVDARGNVMLAILERPGGALWLVERGKPAKLRPGRIAARHERDRRHGVHRRPRRRRAAALPGAVAPRRRVGGQPDAGRRARQRRRPFQGRGGAAGRPAQSGRGRAEPCGGAAPFAGPPRHAGRRAHAQPGLARPNPLPRTESAHVVLASRARRRAAADRPAAGHRSSSWGQRNNPQAETQIARLLAHWRGQAGVARAP